MNQVPPLPSVVAPPVPGGVVSPGVVVVQLVAVSKVVGDGTTVPVAPPETTFQLMLADAGTARAKDATATTVTIANRFRVSLNNIRCFLQHELEKPTVCSGRLSK